MDESGKGKAFEAEYHSRLKFSQRGLVACASQNNMSDSRFFITLNRLDALNFKHTIFGQIVGNTIYNVLKIAELEVDDNDRPVYPPKIIRTEVIVNPFPDIVPRKKTVSDSNIKKRKKKENKNVLSFSDEIEENSEEIKPRKKDKKEHTDSQQHKDEKNKVIEPVEIPKDSNPPKIETKEIPIDKNSRETNRKEETDPTTSTENENTFDDVASRFSSLRKQKEEQIKTDSENKTKQDAKQYLSNQLQKYKKKSSKEDREAKALEKFESFSKLLKSTSSESWKKHELNYKKE